MNITGETVSIYRGTRDKFGDKTETLVGTISNALYQPATGPTIRYDSIGEFGEASKSEAGWWLPRSSAVKAHDKDRIVSGTRTYRAIGDRQWDMDHPINLSNLGYYFITTELVM
ncbi:hypothetical protein [Mycobacterium sp. TY814]|uniref:hypothetical protein n=1 Tax=unclassified Mycobacterium TaxID=2642494 RepID=UPI0027421624|nr:hypothetical protein [Mycobacterium sp. TY814]MDP7725091.1 hypothetical protein [Mycobacterium sp. TY814]